jgi:hypothetical protein
MDQEHENSADRELLQRFLANRDISCPVCAYNLRGLDSIACPECGAKIDLRVGSDDLKLGAWLVALLSVGLPLGFMALFALFLCIGCLLYGAVDELMVTIVCLLVGALVYGIALWSLIGWRRSFWRRSRLRQRAMAGVISAFAWGVVAVYLVVIFRSFA